MKIGPFEIGLKKQEPKSKVVAGKSQDLYARATKIESLTPQQLRFIGMHESLFYKATNKKNRDTVQSWFTIKKLDGTEPFKEDIKLLNDFARRIRLKQKLQLAGVCKDIYGDGFIEKIYLQDKGRSASDPPKNNAEPIGLKVLNTEDIQHTKVEKGQKYFIYRSSGIPEKLLHPDRLIHVKEGLPYSDFGFSKVESLRNILKSVMNTDIATGEILDWSSHGILDFTIENSTSEQEKYMDKLIKKGNHYFIHDENYTLQVLNPEMGEPKSYFDWFTIKIAAMFEMPTHVLTGVQPGRLTGTEVGIADYHKDLANDQDMIFTPLIEDLFEEFLKSRKRRWQYMLVWNPTFVDELAEGQIMEKRTLSAVQGYTSKIIGRSEGRKIMKDGVIDIIPSDVPKDLAKDPKPLPGNNPNINPQQPKDKKPVKKESNWRPLTELEKARIAELKSLGEEILQEQDDRSKRKGT